MTQTCSLSAIICMPAARAAPTPTSTNVHMHKLGKSVYISTFMYLVLNTPVRAGAVEQGLRRLHYYIIHYIWVKILQNIVVR